MSSNPPQPAPLHTAGTTPAHTSRSAARLRRIVPIVVGCIALAGAAYVSWRYFGSGKVDDQYLIETVQRGDVEDIVTATGTLQPRDYVDVGAQVSGQLKKVHVEVGAQVKQGDLLADIDPTVAQARVDADRAQLANQQAQLADREGQLLQAQRQFARQQAMMKEGATTTEAVQTAETTLRSARAQIEVIKAQMRQTESTLRGNEANLSYTRIYAPMTGTVVSQTAKQGQTLNANQSAPIILRIADLSVMTVETQVSEADVGKLRPGMPVYFTTLAGQNRRWTSTLQDVQPTPTVTNNVVLYNARFEVPNPNQALMTQMTAQVYFVAASAHDTVVVPAAAVRLQGESGERRRGPRRSADSTGDTVAGSAVTTAADPAGQPGTSARNAQPGVGTDSEGARRGRRRDALATQDVAATSSSRRYGIVRVIHDKGTIEDRQVEVGVSNRVQMQILSGLKEGERIIVGVRVPEAPRAQRQATQGGLSGGPTGGYPGGGGPRP